MDWFKRKDKKIKEKIKAIPDGLWEKCPSCSEILFKPELDKNFVSLSPLQLSFPYEFSQLH